MTKIMASLAFAVGAAVMGCTSSAPPGNGGASGVAGAGSVCAKIPQADAQALLARPITSVDDFSAEGSCVFRYGGQGDGGLEINFFRTDPDLKYYHTLQTSHDHALGGVGEMAYWNQEVDGVTTPQISAHAGDVTCTIQPPDPPDSIVKTTPGGSPLGYTIGASDAAAFAALLGVLCNDVFAAQ